MAEDRHLLDVPHHVSELQLYFTGQQMHQPPCDIIGGDIGSFKRLFTEVTKVDEGVLDIFWLPGLIDPMKEGECSGKKYVDDVSTAFIPGKWEEYCLCVVED